MMTWKTMKTLTAGMMTVFATVFVMGNTAPTCVPLDEPEMQVVCLDDGECAGLGTELDCVGKWACENGACVFHCDDDPEPPISECVEDGDCAPNQHCEIVDCWAPPCEEDGPCSLCCMAIGECVDDDPGECFVDSDCPPGFACEFMDGPGACDCDPDDEFCLMYECMAMGQCVPSEIEGECDEDADCGPGASCAIEEVCSVSCFCDGDDCPEEMDCFLFGTCIDVPVPPQSECLYDEDCKDGQICDLTEGPYPCDCDPDDEVCLMMYCMPVGICVDLPDPTKPCQPTGCSGQLCAAIDIETTCQWLPHYVCFQDAICGPNGPNGACAWEHTDALSACLALYLTAP
ncbi:MAG: hypothetical protein ABIK09_09825 [Pseudomonadota bacterium]